MEKSKFTYKQALVIMGYTGVSTIKFTEFHKDVQFRLGRAIYTHQFGDKSIVEEIKQAYREDFIAMCHS